MGSTKDDLIVITGENLFRTQTYLPPHAKQYGSCKPSVDPTVKNKFV